MYEWFKNTYTKWTLDKLQNDTPYNYGQLCHAKTFPLLQWFKKGLKFF